MYLNGIKVSNAQSSVIKHLKNGACLQCGEGEKYRTWLVLKNGMCVHVRRNTADIICDKFAEHLKFGGHNGIYWR